MPNLEQKLRHLNTEHLMIAEGKLYTEPLLVQTVLGSCVSVSFFHPRKNIGAIFHSLLPQFSAYETDEKNAAVFRYVDSAITRMVQAFGEINIKPSSLECKVFGGANALFPKEVSVGEKNVRTAFESLAKYNLRVVASNVGGMKGRKILFLPHTGDVFVKLLNNTTRTATKK